VIEIVSINNPEKVIYKSKIATNLREAVIEAIEQQINLSYADLFEANLNNVDFTGTNLDKANFSNANLQGAIFTYASLIEADFREANLKGADFHEANLTGANLDGAYLIGTNLSPIIEFKNKHNNKLLEMIRNVDNILGATTYALHEAWNALTDHQQEVLYEQIRKYLNYNK